MDWLECDLVGCLVIVDIKIGKILVSKDDV